ncbi:hypothetical protein GUITHDRAFT_137310 [Guillardia theta CCMP2712]|uniref:Solute-binding protein family 3/N-terminal domain-containing protein n=1 Tax=Guillardia theta (strain CCMP2712) TaxID=905079 RepID=L1JHF2_GUITC|nr:hypothetical protein GUITHDRAFT_137310 [Guillardia theta CCMP2712]EKX47525.1 hypothetical protein GUITHDRAFT_137310 [Guillardia theta CCMP2712]|eukprot:XP_005834505.1 hypothetical protein GUITHDRAFT_137310 [Guillardia theta CCMP2712]
MDEGFGNRTFIVSTYHCPPFVMYDPAQGTFQGLTVDLLNILEPILQAKFKFTINKDDTESIDTALKAVSTGELVISMPDAPPNLWQFFTPFSNTLWTGVVLEMFIVAIDVVPGWVWGLLDAFYWSITVLLQIVDKSPRTWGAKMLMMAHGWFMLIVVASYTGWTDITASQGAYKLSLPFGGATMDFILNEELMNNYVFNISWTSSWPEAFDLLLRKKVQATLHDEALAQYYLQEASLLRWGKRSTALGDLDEFAGVVEKLD